VAVRLLQVQPDILQGNSEMTSVFEAFGKMTNELLKGYDSEDLDFSDEKYGDEENSESHATVSGVTYHMKDHDSTVDSIGQADEVATEILRRTHTSSKALEQSNNLTQQQINIKKLASESYKNLMQFPDNLGPLKDKIEDIPSETRRYFEEVEPCRKRSVHLYRSHKPAQRVAVYYDDYADLKDSLDSDLLFLIAKDTETGELYDVGRCGSEAKFGTIFINPTDDTLKKFCYLYEQGDTPTTGLGFSNVLHFLIATHIFEFSENFSIEENRVDLIVNGTPFEISTRFEKSFSSSKVYVDKYSLGTLCLDPRFNKLMAASYASDRGMTDYLSDMRRSEYDGEYLSEFPEFENSLKQIVETHASTLVSTSLWQPHTLQIGG